VRPHDGVRADVDRPLARIEDGVGVDARTRVDRDAFRLVDRGQPVHLAAHRTADAGEVGGDRLGVPLDHLPRPRDQAGVDGVARETETGEKRREPVAAPEPGCRRSGPQPGRDQPLPAGEQGRGGRLRGGGEPRPRQYCGVDRQDLVRPSGVLGGGGGRLPPHAHRARARLDGEQRRIHGVAPA
jgi:hypothetical protein